MSEAGERGLLEGADEASRRAARRAGVRVGEAHEIDGLREAAALFGSVWGRTDEGVPLNSEVMRSLVHAGGCVTTAHDDAGHLAGAAALVVAAPAGATYSLIAAAAPGANDRGIGLALKLRQRSWALGRGYHSMSWTFDPLVARNARFNLVKLGAEASTYVVGFYGEMADGINAADQSDRLVATWRLYSQRAVSAASGGVADLSGPAPGSEVCAEGPDGAALVRRDAQGTWLRVPPDIVGLRRSDPAVAAGWRVAVRHAFQAALAEGLAARHLTRSDWYLLTRKDET